MRRILIGPSMGCRIHWSLDKTSLVLSSAFPIGGPEICSEGTDGEKGEEEEEEEEEKEKEGAQGNTRISRYLSGPFICSSLEPLKKLRESLFDHSSIAEGEKGKPEDGR